MRFRRLIAVATLAAALSLATGCGGDGEEPEPAPTPETPSEEPTGAPSEEEPAAEEGQQIFVENCGSCHVLADAGTSGTVGPSLDEIQPDRERVLSAIETGPGAMPENVVTGSDAETVADYVSENAGK